MRRALVRQRSFSGLCAITPDTDDSDALVAAAAAALAGGANILQYRRKTTAADGLFLQQARRLQALCEQHHALFIINDDVAAVKQLGADGAHLGADDMPIPQAREILGDGALIGATCGGDLGAARRAAANGADYVAFGAVFPSATKPSARACPPSRLAEAKALINLPLVAIGGITPANIGEVAQVADCAAVCAGVFFAGGRRDGGGFSDTADITAAAAQLSAAFAGERRRAAS